MKKEFVEPILNCQWLQRCGQIDNFGFDVEYLSSKCDVEKKFHGIKWGNICLQRSGDFTVYLFKNHREEYNKYWDDGVRLIKEQYISKISDKVNIALINCNLSVDILADIQMNILSIFMLEYYSEYYSSCYSSDFYNKMLEIYLAGHLPCGWTGGYPNGKFIVY